MQRDVMESLFTLIDGCRTRGVLRLRLHDGTEIALDPTHDLRLREEKKATGPMLMMPDTLPAEPDPPTLQRDAIAAELDGVLFGKPLTE